MRQASKYGRRNSIVTALLVVFAVAAWFVAGPSQFGGPATYLITNGTSMQPRFHTGDLAVIRKADSYGVGDIIGYRLAAHSIVLHRIVGRDGSRFIMKGDNNSWRDSTHPDQSQVAGKLWIHVPGVGRAIEWLHAPSTVAVLVAVAGIAMTMSKKERPRNGRRNGDRRMSNEAGSLRQGGLPPATDLLAIAAAVALAALVLAIVAFGHPLKREGVAHATYQQGGAFSYSSIAPGDVYAGNRVLSGDPIFLALIRNLDVHFDYKFASASAQNLHGTYALSVEIGQESGWTRTLTLLPPAAFTGNHVELSSTVPLQTVQAMTAAFAGQTGVKGGNYNLTLVPVVHVQGAVAGSVLDEEYSPKLPFLMDSYQLAIDRSSDPGDVLHPSALGVVSRPKQEANTFTLAGRSVTVGFVRMLALLILAVATFCISLLGRAALAAARAGEPERIQSRYGGMLLHVAGQPPAARSSRALEVLRFEDLARVAEQQGRMILHSQSGSRHDYVVGDWEVLYHYATTEDGCERTPAEEVQHDAA